jgi:uncharacterized membrane protein YkoI
MESGMKGLWKRGQCRDGRRWLAPLLAVLVASSPLAHADDSEDHDRARQALEAGDILPLKTVLEKVSTDTPGSVLEVELDRRHGRWVYEIKLLRQGGSVVKLWVDASNGNVIDRRGRGERQGR